MLRKEILEICTTENSYQNLKDEQVEFNSLKEDFCLFSQQYMPDIRFQDQSQHYDPILSMIEEVEPGSYEEFQELQRRVSLCQESTWDFSILDQLKEKYSEERNSIVESGLLVRQLNSTFADVVKQFKEENSQFSQLFTPLFSESMGKNIFLWQLMDELIQYLERKKVGKMGKGRGDRKSIYLQHQNDDEKEHSAATQLTDLLDSLHQMISFYQN